MKKRFLVFIILNLLVSSLVFAQIGKPKWYVDTSANLRCWQCKDILENYLYRQSDQVWESAIIQIRFNLLNGSFKIQYHPERVTLEELKVAVNNAGFDTKSDSATIDSYNSLPAICKRAQDGGGPKHRQPCHVPIDDN
ncbi:MAG: hypothetical protein QM528_03790 [Phycisphaerales bacterium]|nr:hypothetical protein [Phycisphaerales bacterium]